MDQRSDRNSLVSAFADNLELARLDRLLEPPASDAKISCSNFEIHAFLIPKKTPVTFPRLSRTSGVDRFRLPFLPDRFRNKTVAVLLQFGSAVNGVSH